MVINMIKNIKIFANDNAESFMAGKLVKEKLERAGFCINNENYELAVAIGGDGSFLRMIKKNNFNSDIYYVGVNTGTLGFMQEIKMSEIDKFIEEILEEKYKVENIGIQEIIINNKEGMQKYYSLNEILIRDIELKLTKLNIYIDDFILEKLISDGVLIASSMGSTAHNLSYGGSIVFPEFSTLQITPLGVVNSKVYRSINNSIIVPDKKIINVIPDNKDLLVTIDGENIEVENAKNIETKIDDKYIKVLRLQKYNFTQKMNEKLL